MLVSLLLATGALAAPSAPHIDVKPPWVLVTSDDTHIALRHEHTGHGVRIERGAHPGVSPVLDGVTLRAGDEPLLAIPWPDDPLRSVWVASQSIDLIIRLEAASLREHTEHTDAPEDPVLTQVRVRLRDDSLRLVLTGLATVQLPAHGLSVTPVPDGARLEPDGWSVRLTTDAPASTSALDTSTWRLDLRPSLEATEPYPTTVVDVARRPEPAGG